MKYIFPELNDKNGRECTMRRGVQESGLTVLTMVLHGPGPETSMLYLIFSTININFDYTSAGMLKQLP